MSDPTASGALSGAELLPRHMFPQVLNNKLYREKNASECKSLIDSDISHYITRELGYSLLNKILAW
jgi:hypothetical protein